MTTTQQRATSMPSPPDDTPPVLALGAARLLAGVHQDRPLTYAEHLTVAGQLAYRSREWLCDAAMRVSMVGRGGAAFPVATKLGAVPIGRATEILVNGSESEPASSKDRVLMRRAPHRVIDGALVAATALQTDRITIAAHDHYAASVLANACRERPDARHVTVVATPGGFVGGEVRALIKSLDGRPAVPDGRRTLPHVRGLHKHPTFASNAETFAQLGALAALGVDDYAALGVSSEPGTSLVTMLGAVPHPGVAEVPHGAALELLTGPLDGRPVLIGGYHGTWTTEPALILQRADLHNRRAPLGAGVLAVLPMETCALGEISRVAHWLAQQSAQQCGPCMFGLASLAHDLGALHAGARLDLTELRRRAGLLVGRGACSNPDGAVRFIGSALVAFTAEVEAHRSGPGCGRPVLGVLPVPEAVA